jgi:hypothetical protein
VTPKPGPGVPMPSFMAFFCGIVDHHCLNFLFILYDGINTINLTLFSYPVLIVKVEE